jgi:hypothetical protein
MPSPQRLAGAKTVPAGGIATGVNADGKPETLGFDVISAQDGHGRGPRGEPSFNPAPSIRGAAGVPRGGCGIP